MKSEQVWDGEPFDIEGDEVRLVCCHCGLTHDVKIEKRRGGYRMTVWVNNRSTAARRRKTNATGGTGSPSRRQPRG